MAGHDDHVLIKLVQYIVYLHLISSSPFCVHIIQIIEFSVDLLIDIRIICKDINWVNKISENIANCPLQFARAQADIVTVLAKSKDIQVTRIENWESWKNPDQLNDGWKSIF